MCVCFQPRSFNSKARKRLPSRQLLAWLDNVFSIVEYIVPVSLDSYAEISSTGRVCKVGRRTSEDAVCWILDDSVAQAIAVNVRAAEGNRLRGVFVSRNRLASGRRRVVYGVDSDGDRVGISLRPAGAAVTLVVGAD